MQCALPSNRVKVISSYNRPYDCFLCVRHVLTYYILNILFHCHTLATFSRKSLHRKMLSKVLEHSFFDSSLSTILAPNSCILKDVLTEVFFMLTPCLGSHGIDASIEMNQNFLSRFNSNSLLASCESFEVTTLILFLSPLNLFTALFFNKAFILDKKDSLESFPLFSSLLQNHTLLQVRHEKLSLPENGIKSVTAISSMKVRQRG